MLLPHTVLSSGYCLCVVLHVLLLLLHKHAMMRTGYATVSRHKIGFSSSVYSHLGLRCSQWHVMTSEIRGSIAGFYWAIHPVEEPQHEHLYLWTFSHLGKRNRTRTLSLSSWLQKTFPSMDIVFIDNFNLLFLELKSFFWKDGIHPSRLGAEGLRNSTFYSGNDIRTPQRRKGNITARLNLSYVYCSDY